MSSNSEKAKKITNSVATFIAKDLCPYSVVVNQGFRAMLHTLDFSSRLDHSFTTFLHRYSDTSALQRNQSSSYGCTAAGRVAVTCDAWTSVATESYVTVHFIADNWQLESHVFQTRAMFESHTGVNVAELLQKVAEEWQCKHGCCYSTGGIPTCEMLCTHMPVVSRLLGRIRHMLRFSTKAPSLNTSLRRNRSYLVCHVTS